MELIKTYPVYLTEQIQYLYSLQADVNEMPDTVHRHLPDGTLEFIVNLGGQLLQSADGKKWFTSPDVMVTGLFTEKNIIKYTGKVHLAGVIFRPGYASLFVNDNLGNFSRCVYDAGLVYDFSVAALREQMSRVSGEVHKHHLMESFLVARIKKDYDEYYIKKIKHAVDIIHQNKGNIEINTLYQNVFMSERNFRRRFKELVGLTPKKYSGIIRTKSIVKSHEKFNIPLTDLLYTHGYSDPSHFVNDFKKISGVTPNLYFKQMNPVDSLYIRYNQQ